MVLTEDKGPIESHGSHSERLMEHAVEQLELDDRLQASEKAWGATAHRLKTFTNRRGWIYGNHRDANKVIHRIAQETGDDEIRRLFDVASGLHQNYYLDSDDLFVIEAKLNDVGEFIRKLDRLDEQGFGLRRPRLDPPDPGPFRQRRGL